MTQCVQSHAAQRIVRERPTMQKAMSAYRSCFAEALARVRRTKPAISTVRFHAGGLPQG